MGGQEGSSCTKGDRVHGPQAEEAVVHDRFNDSCRELTATSSIGPPEVLHWQGSRSGFPTGNQQPLSAYLVLGCQHISEAVDEHDGLELSAASTQDVAGMTATGHTVFKPSMLLQLPGAICGRQCSHNPLCKQSCAKASLTNHYSANSLPRYHDLTCVGTAGPLQRAHSSSGQPG